MTDNQNDIFVENDKKLSRIVEIMADLHIKSYSDLSKEINISQGYISEILNKKKDVPKTFGQKLEDYLGVNRKWFESGVGERYLSNIPEKTEAVAIGQIHRSDEESPYVDLGNGQFLMVVPLIPIRASAGYRENYQDQNYVSTHYDKHYFPVTRQYRGKYFAFVIDGDSMDNGVAGEAIQDGSTVTGREIQKQHWTNKFHLHSFKDYIIVHKDVILIKRIIEHDTVNGTILCHSLNPDKVKHGDFLLNLNDCLQILNIVNVTQTR